MRRFKAKRKNYNGSFILIIFVVLTVYLSHKLTKFITPNELLMRDIKQINVDFDESDMLFKLGLNYRKPIIKEEAVLNTFTENPIVLEPEEPVLVKKKIYLYSTHHKEEYANGNVIDADYIFQEILNKSNLDVTFENVDISSIMEKNNYSYKDSYKVTRELINNNLNNYDLFIDLHRDSSSKKNTTTNFDNKDYAKIMFVVGGKHDTHMENYNLANILNENIKNIVPNISRGIFVRRDSSFNQDLSNKTLLIEVGGVYNSLEEVSNTLTLLANVISAYLE